MGVLALRDYPQGDHVLDELIEARGTDVALTSRGSRLAEAMGDLDDPTHLTAAVPPRTGERQTVVADECESVRVPLPPVDMRFAVDKPHADLRGRNHVVNIAWREQDVCGYTPRG